VEPLLPPQEAPDAALQDAARDQLSTIGRKAGRGLRWSLFGTLLTKAGSFVVSLVLVRLLDPHDFGLYAVALAATAFVMHVNDMGVIAATVQWRGRVEDMAATGATIALGFSLAWYAFFWVLAPQFAELAGSTEATPLVRLLTATIIIDGITAVRVGVIQRGFHQDQLTKAIFAGFLANATTAIIMAANGYGAYSFVIGQLVQSVVTGALVLWMARMPFRYGLDPAIAKRLLKFGLPLAAALGIESILLYSDSLIVGHMLGTVMLGYYLLAFNISSWVPGLLGAAIRYVSIPSFSRLAEQEPDVFASGVRRAIPMLISVVVPVAAVMVVLAPEMIQFLYGARWEPAAQALHWLAFVMIGRMLVSLSFDIQTGLGRTTTPVWINATWCAVLVPSLILGASFGTIGHVAFAHAMVALFVAIPLAVWALYRAGISLRSTLPRVARTVFAGVVGGLVMLGISLATVGWPAVWILCLAGGCGLLVYLAIIAGRNTIVALPRLVRERVGARRVEA
jgi:PST family polysaccharide transporter